jgi:hypothetical protein
MLKIQRSQNGGVLFTVSGRIEAEDVSELKRLLQLEAPGQHLTMDLGDVTIVDRDGVRFLARCEAESITLENCPKYIREWIKRESAGNTPVKPVNNHRCPAPRDEN